jgi:aminoglycoside phosphotransferase family enzyme
MTSSSGKDNEPLLDLPDEMLDSYVYPHACGPIETIETHMSWVFLTGDYAYKVKKPVHFDFVDFSTLELREFFCAQEMECNRRFAPELYIGVVPITRDSSTGHLCVDGPGEPLEYAVRMRQFDTAMQMDHLVEADAITSEEMRSFGTTIGLQHRNLPAPDKPQSLEKQILDPVQDNFDAIRSLPVWQAHARIFADLEARTKALTRDLLSLLRARSEAGHVRECHGDLHLSNMVKTDAGIRAFDCLEFSEDLRVIDTMNDVAFLLMDCDSRSRADLGYAFLDGYLDVTGDYDGLRLLTYFVAYRSLVRVKVNALHMCNVRGTGCTAIRGVWW